MIRMDNRLLIKYVTVDNSHVLLLSRSFYRVCMWSSLHSSGYCYLSEDGLIEYEQGLLTYRTTPKGGICLDYSIMLTK